MIIVRPINKNDIEAFTNIAFIAGIGMTSMPKNPELLEKKITLSEQSFLKDVKEPGQESYLFVLEDLSIHAIGGTSGITAKTGKKPPKFFFNIKTVEEDSPFLSTKKYTSLMHAVCYREAPTEIGSLYLLPEFRHGGHGRLLSLSRFLFTAVERHRFDTRIYSEMRGFVDNFKRSPVWEGIGRHFFDIEYSELIELTNSENFDISHVLPKYPIYISLLPKEVQKAIGKVHTNTIPALTLLQDEGFCSTSDVDIFDGGPKIEAVTDQLRTIKSSCLNTVVAVSKQPIESDKYMITNNNLNFRACYSTLIKSKKGVTIPEETAQALNIDIGCQVRYVLPFRNPAHARLAKEKRFPS